MHYFIRILTEGETRKQAHDNALDFAEDLVERGEFDSYDYPHAKTYKLASALGKKTVEAALRANRQEFDVAIQAARLMLQEFTDEQLYQDEYPPEPRAYYASRWQFSQVGDTRSFMYGDHGVWGEKIRNDRDYQAATEGHDNLWVTCMGFHN
jgi:hypothetical protein